MKKNESCNQDIIGSIVNLRKRVEYLETHRTVSDLLLEQNPVFLEALEDARKRSCATNVPLKPWG